MAKTCDKAEVGAQREGALKEKSVCGSVQLKRLLLGGGGRGRFSWPSRATANCFSSWKS